MRHALALTAALLLGVPGLAPAQDRSLQEMVLRSKPPVVIVVAEVGGQVTLRCGDAEKTVSPVPYRESGSGFFISPRGWVITNGHVVFIAHDPPGGGEAMSGRDLALLRVEASDMPTLQLGDSSAVKIGDKLSIIGFPGVVMSHELLSASAKAQASVTQGAVSGYKQDRANQP